MSFPIDPNTGRYYETTGNVTPAHLLAGQVSDRPRTIGPYDNQKSVTLIAVPHPLGTYYTSATSITTSLPYTKSTLTSYDQNQGIC
jgi:hypothetical protein